MSIPFDDDKLGPLPTSTSKKRASTDAAHSSTSRKRRRDAQRLKPQDVISTDNSFAALSFQPTSTGLPNDESDRPRTHMEHILGSGDTTKMAEVDFGSNRLAKGFPRPQATRQDSKSSGEVTSGLNASNTHGESSASPIEVSDDEMEESEGGMVVNIDQDNASMPSPASDLAQSQESGEIVATPEDNIHSPDDAIDLFVVDATPSMPVQRLVDLSPAELEDQLRYAFFHLDRDQIDLNRPVICLTCRDEGHVHGNCDQKSTDLLRLPKIDPKSQFKLWISCCLCASKSHLVGDCPRMRTDQAARWSLKALNPEQIVNLSLETGTQKLEKEAGNRGMRPAGLQIRGRANMHHAGVPEAEASSEDDEPFLRGPVKRRQDNSRNDHVQSQRYDRFNPPSGHQSYRGGGQWYHTDSFGRRRSRSPADRYDKYRSRDEYGKSRGSSPGDNRGPPPPRGRRNQYKERLPSPHRESRAPTAVSRDVAVEKAGPNIQFSLPTRKGSNTWSQTGPSGDSTLTPNGTSSEAYQAKKKKNRGRNKPNNR